MMDDDEEVLPPLSWSTVAQGTMVQVCSGEELLSELLALRYVDAEVEEKSKSSSCLAAMFGGQQYDAEVEEKSKSSSCLAAMFGGQRCVVTHKAVSALEIAEAAGRVECALIRDKKIRAGLPLGVLSRDLLHLRLQREREMAVAIAAESIQCWWRVAVWRGPLRAEALLRVEERKEARFMEMATRLQRVQRGNLTRADEGLQQAQEACRARKEKRRQLAIRDAIEREQQEESERLEAAEEAERAAEREVKEQERRRLSLRFIHAAARRYLAVLLVAPLLEETRARERDFKNGLLSEFKASVEAGDEARLADVYARLQDIGVPIDVLLGDVTALVLACLRGKLKCARFLRERGADCDARRDCPSGWTPLQRACLRGHVGVVRWLGSTSPARLCALNKKGSTLAHAAIPPGRVEVLNFILKRAPSMLSQPNNQMDTPLHFAVVMAKPKLVEFLLQHAPASMDIVNHDGLTPFATALRNGADDVIDIFRNAAGRLGRKLEGDDLASSPPPPPRSRSPKKKKQSPRRPRSPPSRRRHPGMSSLRHSKEHDWAIRDERCSRWWLDCCDLKQALPRAWRAASADVCEKITLRKTDLKTVLSALGVLEEQEDDGNEIAWIDLKSTKTTRDSLLKAASDFGLLTDIDDLFAKVARRRLLELVRSPPSALRWIAERFKEAVSFEESDLAQLLEACHAPREIVVLDDVSLESARAWMRRPGAAEPDTDGPALLYTRARFHVALLLRLAEWAQKGARFAAGSGAASALMLQQLARPDGPNLLKPTPGAWANVDEDEEEDASSFGSFNRHKAAAPSPIITVL